MDRKETFIETIALLDGKVGLLALHQERMERTAEAFGWSAPQLPNLEDLCPEELCQGRVKCRVLYQKDIQEISFEAYQRRSVKKLALALLPKGYTYKYKSSERSVLNQLREDSQADEVLLMDEDGYLRDTSYTNLIFFKDGEWFTPEKALLEGVQRAYLLQTGRIQKADIHKDDLQSYSHLALINALMPFEERIQLPISSIVNLL